MWGATDGNMIAADAHYDAPAAYDHSYCEECLRPFRESPDDEPDNDALANQDGSAFHLCKSCVEGA